MMRTDGGGELERPRGAVLGPLAFLLAAAATGAGMWHVLMRDGDTPPVAEQPLAADARGANGTR